MTDPISILVRSASLNRTEFDFIESQLGNGFHQYELCVGEISVATGSAATKKEAKRKCAENALENGFKINTDFCRKNDFSQFLARNPESDR